MSKSQNLTVRSVNLSPSKWWQQFIKFDLKMGVDWIGRSKMDSHDRKLMSGKGCGEIGDKFGGFGGCRVIFFSNFQAVGEKHIGHYLRVIFNAKR